MNHNEYTRNWAKNNRNSRNVSQALYRSKHPSFVNWDSMKARCYRVQHKAYENYGGRGITVYLPWLDFSTYEKEFGHTKPGHGYCVDRINNNKNYEPGNVQWLTRSENIKKMRREHGRN